MHGLAKQTVIKRVGMVVGLTGSAVPDHPPLPGHFSCGKGVSDHSICKKGALFEAFDKGGGTHPGKTHHHPEIIYKPSHYVR